MRLCRPGGAGVVSTAIVGFRGEGFRRAIEGLSFVRWSGIRESFRMEDMLFCLEATPTDPQVRTIEDGRLKIETQSYPFHRVDKPVLDLGNRGD